MSRRRLVRLRPAGTLACALALAAGSILAPGAADAQKLEKVPTPIDVTAKPALVLVGGVVELSGASVVLQRRANVTLVVRNPQGKQLTLTAALDGNGRYSSKVQAQTLGTYQVVATAPDGKARAQTTFAVAAPVAFGEQAVTAARQLLATAQQNVGKLAAAAAKAPPSPPQQDLIGRLDELSGRLSGAPQQLDQLEVVIQDVDTIVGPHSATLPEFQPFFDALGEVNERASGIADDLVERVRQIEVGITDCDRLDMLGEALSFLGLALDLVGKPIQVIGNLAADKTFSARLSARDPALAANGDAKAVADNAVKHIATLMSGVEGWLSNIYSYVGDLAGLAAQKVFGVYCEKFEGPFEAKFHLEYRQGSATWLAYDVGLKGMLFLRYEKGSSPTQVSGEFEGVAEFDGLRENFLLLEPWAKPYTIARFVRSSPLATGGGLYLPEAGKLGRAALGMLRVNPSYFFVPVEGLLTGSSLALKFKPATQDYPDRVKGRVVYVLVEPSLPIPEVAKVDVQYQGAGYILSRATHKGRGSSGEPFPLQITVDAKNKVSRIDQTFNRHENEPGSFDLTWNLRLNACNPACPY